MRDYIKHKDRILLGGVASLLLILAPLLILLAPFYLIGYLMERRLEND